VQSLQTERRKSSGLSIFQPEAYMKRVEIKLLKKTCVLCHDRRARYRYRGRVRWNPQHNVCFQCRRSYLDRLRAESAPEAGTIRYAEDFFVASPAPILNGPERFINPAFSDTASQALVAGLAAAAGPAQDAALSGGSL
jgi:hypothetical protein